MFTIRLSFLFMVAIVASSNYLVQFPINDWLTWGALTYPVSFLVTELTNWFHGTRIAKRVIWAGFFVGVAISWFLAEPRIAIASGLAYLVAQFFDLYLFNHLRQRSWWIAPLLASVLATGLDTAIFWTVAFYGVDLPIVTLALGDFTAKFVLDLGLLAPFRLIIRNQQSTTSISA